MPAMVVYLDNKTHFTLYIDHDVDMADADDAGDYTSVLLSLAYAHRRLEIKEDDFAIRLISRSGSLSVEEPRMVVPFDTNLWADGRYGDGYLIRDDSNSPYYYESLLPTKPPIESVQKAYRGFTDDPEDEPYLVLRKYPRGPGFFRRPPPQPQPPSTKLYPRVLPASGAMVDTIPLEYAELGFIVPSLIHYVGLYLTATELSKTLLAPLGLSDISMIVDAICASGAQTPTNYERIEFLGDSILKLCTTVNVAATSKSHVHCIEWKGRNLPHNLAAWQKGSAQIKPFPIWLWRIFDLVDPKELLCGYYQITNILSRTSLA